MKVGFMGLLTLIFITLKLIGYIDWSWWLVLLPVFAPTVLWLVVLIIAAVLKFRR